MSTTTPSLTVAAANIGEKRRISTSISGSGKTICTMAAALFSTSSVISMRGIGGQESGVGWEGSLTLEARFMRENGWLENSMVSVNIITQTAIRMRAAGLMECVMERECW